MANFVWSAKSGSDWSYNHLIAYNITILSLSPDEFSPTPDLHLNDIDPDILNSTPSECYTDCPLSQDTHQFLSHLNLISRATPEFSSQFAISALQYLEF